MGIFADAVKQQAHVTYTENGQIAKDTTENPLLDLFAVIGALRDNNANFDKERLERMVLNAFNYDPYRTVKLLFYARDVRCGLGERDVAKLGLYYLVKHHHEDCVIPNLELLPVYGRWDDLYAFRGTEVMPRAYDVMRATWLKDIQALDEKKDSVSLLAKWVKTPDASSERTKEVGIETALALEDDVRSFKRHMRALRKKINIVEAKMSANEWDDIQYANLPARAMHVHKKAFERHDPLGFGNYIASLVKGETKVNSSTLYPYDIVKELISVSRGAWIPLIKDTLSQNQLDLLEQQWKALPDMVEGEHNFLVMCDVSGSMYGDPICKSIGLAIYFAERNHGPMQNLFMSFSSDPKYIDLSNKSTLREKITYTSEADVGYGTDLRKAFDLILNTAIMWQMKPEDMPKSLIVISDMEINSGEMGRYVPYGSDTLYFYDEMKQKFAEKGYTIPNIVFWNVASRHDVFHADKNHSGVQLVSGSSTNIFKTLIKTLGMDPVQAMLEVLDSERYQDIVIPGSYMK